MRLGHLQGHEGGAGGSIVEPQLSQLIVEGKADFLEELMICKMTIFLWNLII